MKSTFLLLLLSFVTFSCIVAQFPIEHLIDTDKSISNCHVVDLNGDGKLDILASSGLSYFENEGGGFKEEQYLGNCKRNIFSDDYDNDGDIDVLTMYKGKINYFEMIDQEAVTMENHEVNLYLKQGGFGFSYLVDLDGDGDQDVVGDGISWFENTNGILQLEDEVIIHENEDPKKEHQRLQFVDFDNDSDLDILSYRWTDNYPDPRYFEVLFFENNDADKTFNEPEIIIDSFPGIYLAIFIATDIDNDNDIDLVVNQVEQNVVVFRNNGDNTFEDMSAITPYYDAPAETKLYDINKDGNDDIFTVGHGGIKWVMGTGNGLFEDQVNILSKVDPANPSYDACFGDFDQDGDDDIFYPGIQLQTIPKRIGWHENDYTIINENLEIENTRKFIVPNPIKDQLILFDQDVSSIKIYNLTGSLLLESQENRIDVSSLSPNQYIVVLSNDNKILHTQAITIIR